MGRLYDLNYPGPPVGITAELDDRAIDSNGAVWYPTTEGSPGSWTQQQTSGTELAYASNSSGSAPTFTTEADIAGCSVTFTVGSRPVYVEGYCPLVVNGTAGDPFLVKLTDASNTETGRDIGYTVSVASSGRHVLVRERISTPGTYTRKLRASNNGVGGTVTVFTNVGQGATIRAVSA